MSVYVDDMKAKYRGMIMCHMTSDNSSELHAMAEAIGVQLKWVQNPGTINEHFDICLSKRSLAVAEGAIEVTGREDAKRRLRLKGYSI